MWMLQKGIKIFFFLQDCLAETSQEIEHGGRPPDEIIVRFSVHVTNSVILNDLWYPTARRYQIDF